MKEDARLCLMWKQFFFYFSKDLQTNMKGMKRKEAKEQDVKTSHLQLPPGLIVVLQ